MKRQCVMSGGLRPPESPKHRSYGDSDRSAAVSTRTLRRRGGSAPRSPRMHSGFGGLLILCLLMLASSAHADTYALRGTIYVSDGAGGTKAEYGVVIIEDGKITQVGSVDTVTVPSGATIVSPEGVHITAGLIDANSTAGVVNPATWAEHGSEIVPHLRVLDAVSLTDKTFARLARRGVTTVYVSPGPGSVVGSQGAVVKTAGPLAQRVLRKGGAVKATLGSEAWRRGVGNTRPRGSARFNARRPTTLMGAVFVFREAFSRAGRRQEQGPAGPVLREVLAGKRSLRIQARRRGEIETALRLTQEIGVPFVLEEGIEAYHLLDELAAAKTSVVFGPIAERGRGYRGRTGEADDPCLSTPALLAQRGIPFCLSANDRVGEDGTWAQGMLAVRYGLSMRQAVHALTTAPADLLGGDVAARIGSLGVGRDADVVIWSGEPFEATTRPTTVFVGGEIVHGEIPKTVFPGGGAKPPKKQFK